MTTKRNQEREEALTRLRSWLPPGSTVYTVLRHVSRSGMQREITLHQLEPGNITCLTGNVAHALGMRIGKRDGVIVGGCGMDMGFHVVYELSHALYPNGHGCIGAGCPSNVHYNGDRDYTPHGNIKTGSRCKKEPCTCHDPGVWTYGHMADVGAACSTCGCARVPHWHRDGGYALRHRWI